MILHLYSQDCPSNLTVVHLQKFFLQINKRIPKASSLDIIGSFKWSHQEKNSQHDIHEISRFFLELLQTQITNQGLTANFFEKIHVSFFSSIISANHPSIDTHNILVIFYY
jgi:hypothetical protein